MFSLCASLQEGRYAEMLNRKTTFLWVFLVCFFFIAWIVLSVTVLVNHKCLLFIHSHTCRLNYV